MYVAAVTVLGRLLPAPDRLDRRVEALHLRSCVVVVVLALDLVAGERQHACDGVAVGGVAGNGDRQRSRRVGGDHLDLDALGIERGLGPEVAGRGEDPAQPVGEPCVGHAEIEESGARRLGGLDQLATESLGRQVGRDLTWRASLGGREPQCDVRRVVAVLRISRTLEDDGDAGKLGERAREVRDGIVGGHRAIVGGAAQKPSGTTPNPLSAVLASCGRPRRRTAPSESARPRPHDAARAAPLRVPCRSAT